MADSRLKLLFERLTHGRKNEAPEMQYKENTSSDLDRRSKFMEGIRQNETTQQPALQGNQDDNIYYTIDGQDYPLTSILSFLCIDAEQKGQQPLIPFFRRNDGKYCVSVEYLNPGDKIKLVQKIISHSLDDIGQILLTMNEQSSPDHPYPKLCSRAHMMDYIVQMKCEEGKTDEAVIKIEQMLKEVLEFDHDRKTKIQDIKQDEICI